MLPTHSPPGEVLVGLGRVTTHMTKGDLDALVSIAMNHHVGPSMGHHACDKRPVDSYHGQRIVEIGYASRERDRFDDWLYLLLPAGRSRLAHILGLRVHKAYTLEDIRELVEEAKSGWASECNTVEGDESVYAKSAPLAMECGRDILKRAREGQWDIALKHAEFAASIEKHHTEKCRLWGPVLHAVKSMALIAPPE